MNKKQILEERMHLLQAFVEGKLERNWIDKKWKPVNSWGDVFLLPAEKLRIKPDPVYRPFNGEELSKLVGKVVVRKEKSAPAMVLAQHCTLQHCVILAHYGAQSSLDLLKHWTFRDTGRPCGVLCGVLTESEDESDGIWIAELIQVQTIIERYEMIEVTKEEYLEFIQSLPDDIEIDMYCWDTGLLARYTAFQSGEQNCRANDVHGFIGYPNMELVFHAPFNSTLMMRSTRPATKGNLIAIMEDIISSSRENSQIEGV